MCPDGLVTMLRQLSLTVVCEETSDNGIPHILRDVTNNKNIVLFIFTTSEVNYEVC